MPEQWASEGHGDDREPAGAVSLQPLFATTRTTSTGSRVSSRSRRPITKTPIQSGPNSVERTTFTVPSKPGRYYFQCDVHPTVMNGFLVAEK
jgi:plastocyanin